MKILKYLSSFYLQIVNIISISYGGFCVWPSASFLVLQSEESPFETGPMSDNDAGNVGAMLCVGGVVGTVFFAWCVDRIGRKWSLMLVALPLLIGWLIIPFARNPAQLCISRFFGGFSGGGVFGVIPIYITELAENRIRGILGTFLIFSCNFGNLLAFILGYYCYHTTVAWILSTLVVVYLICLIFLPETPQHLIKKNKVTEAEQSLRYFRNVRSFKLELPEELKNELQKLRSDENSNSLEDSIKFADFNNSTARKALLIGIVLVGLNQFSGLFAMINYTATIFQKAGSDLTPNVAAIVVGSIQMLGSYVSTLLVERAGRKFLLAISAAGTGFGHMVLACYSYLGAIGFSVEKFAWIPVASFSFTVFIACWGVLPLPFLVISETMPPKIRNFGSMISMLCLWCFAFGLLKFLPVMSSMLGMHGMMMIFGVCCFVGALLVLLLVPETKGKSIEEILRML